MDAERLGQWLGSARGTIPAEGAPDTVGYSRWRVGYWSSFRALMHITQLVPLELAYLLVMLGMSPKCTLCISGPRLTLKVQWELYAPFASTICNCPFYDYWSCMVLVAHRDYISLNSIKKLIFEMVKCVVLFEVRTEYLNTIWTRFSFKGLTKFTPRSRTLE
jgi:hypothetical protein